MPVFTSSDELNDVMERLWDSIKSDAGMSEQLLKSKMCVRFYYREPEGRLTVDCRDGQEMKITTGESEIKPDVEMFMKSDVATLRESKSTDSSTRHRFLT